MQIQTLLEEIDILRTKYTELRNLENTKIWEAISIEFTYDSNRIEGNTLSLQETQLVIEKGLTIGGKSLQEHLEAINHKEAIEFVTDLVQNKTPFNESILLQIHGIILKSIDREHAGNYRKVPVLISGSTHIPPQPYLIQKLMEDFFFFYEENKDKLHPVILSAVLHERLVSIHPFIDGNGRTSRLLMNLILLQHGYPIVSIKGDADNRLVYYQALENSSMDNGVTFQTYIASLVKQTLARRIEILTGDNRQTNLLT